MAPSPCTPPPPLAATRCASENSYLSESLAETRFLPATGCSCLLELSVVAYDGPILLYSAAALVVTL